MNVNEKSAAPLVVDFTRVGGKKKNGGPKVKHLYRFHEYHQLLSPGLQKNDLIKIMIGQRPPQLVQKSIVETSGKPECRIQNTVQSCSPIDPAGRSIANQYYF